MHRPELQHHERPAITTQPFLTEDHRTADRHAYGARGRQQDRRQHGQRGTGDEHVQHPLDPP
jgi:hypothetical protein